MPGVKSRVFGGVLLCFIPLLLSSACQSRDQERATPDLFVPPTLAATPLPPTLPPPTKSPPTPTPPCVDNLLFLEDLSIPDGTVVLPGEKLDKRWLVKNEGSCNWDERYRIRFVAGSEMGASPLQALFPARSGTELEIQIVFTAPTESGLLRSEWQALNPAGEPFGDPFYLEIVVAEPTPAERTPAP